MVWEHDGGNFDLPAVGAEPGRVEQHDPHERVRAVARRPRETFGTLEVGAIDPQTPDLLSTIINGRQDGPLGVRQTGGVYSIPNITVVLTREIIEQALSSQWATIAAIGGAGADAQHFRPGILVVNFANVGSTTELVPEWPGELHADSAGRESRGLRRRGRRALARRPYRDPAGRSARSRPRRPDARGATTSLCGGLQQHTTSRRAGRPAVRSWAERSARALD